MMLRLWLISLCLALFIACRYGVAAATLGEPADTIARDTRKFSGVLQKSSVRAKYRVQSFASGTTATTVREYVTPSGIVFAVAWNGLVHPDLQALLGNYHQDYSKARSRAVREPGRRGAKVTTERLVVETWGHMRNLQGRAYLPELLPEGVSVDEIR
ncbi:DUF2844 domain-containing protein [Geomonas anaerohicana]|uniref:DUF2844 domain-containing protein n=1 Tax=Geomonas anaerohicana TaxID=2798583 RepID=A0ABS0YDD3_9BACT|nr:DUF2844 domain-containing protein [Geomonas anaerohicana]MBJ6750295.1 DUF2844 domain-containing protein [Geomonas anaerohicana]